MPAFHFTDLPTFGRVSRDREPNFCPHCAHRVVPEELEWNLTPSTKTGLSELECTCRCPNQDCGRLFIATYQLQSIDAKNDLQSLLQFAGSDRAIFKLHSSYPTHTPKTNFSTEIAELSPTFLEIYWQAEAAEALALTQICGLGYRKAVEYLVKDYCVSRVAGEEGRSVLALSVAQCISRFVDDARIKSVATRAAWLGNDEAHYVRKWIDKDVSDLKVLIRLLGIWIESTILTFRFQDEMPGRNDT
ncbi:DUF4145 domain-containing protein [Xanthomonas arboricola]|uniref:DUF4145 domain-containing protein n=1 Tax=Xanthomonas arboricola TaxID=56448 RepID=UPI000C843186|nr:DUF4145 domain-containing protein [Xanthomonas arboricola]PPT17173.1 hypothetical protein XarCFBP6771_20530 [Xanthomonas arboricola]SOU08929.1 hypothetical protein LMG19145_00010 [Xanthomonas arboricola pv. fragariae]